MLRSQWRTALSFSSSAGSVDDWYFAVHVRACYRLISRLSQARNNANTSEGLSNILFNVLESDGLVLFQRLMDKQLIVAVGARIKRSIVWLFIQFLKR